MARASSPVDAASYDGESFWRPAVPSCRKRRLCGQVRCASTRASVAKGLVGLVDEGWWVLVVDGVLWWLMVDGEWWMAVAVVVA